MCPPRLPLLPRVGSFSATRRKTCSKPLRRLPVKTSGWSGASEAPLDMLPRAADGMKPLLAQELVSDLMPRLSFDV